MPKGVSLAQQKPQTEVFAARRPLIGPTPVPSQVDPATIGRHMPIISGHAPMRAEPHRTLLTLDGSTIDQLDDLYRALARTMALSHEIQTLQAFAELVHTGAGARYPKVLLAWAHADRAASVLDAPAPMGALPPTDAPSDTAVPTVFQYIERVLYHAATTGDFLHYALLDLTPADLSPIFARILESQPPARLRFGAARGVFTDGSALLHAISATMRLAAAPSEQAPLGLARARLSHWLCRDLAYDLPISEPEEIDPLVEAAFDALGARRAWLNEHADGSWTPLTQATFDRCLVVEGTEGMFAVTAADED